MNILQKTLAYFPWPDHRPTRGEIGDWLIMPFVALMILTQERFAITMRFFENRALLAHFRGLNQNELIFVGQIYCVVFTFVLFVILPLVYQLLLPMEGKNALGLKIRGTRQHYPPYLFLLSIMVPTIWVVSYTEHFNQFYPLYDPSDSRKWVIFETIYLCGFFSIEFFFRGFILFRLERFLKGYAVLVMTIPYAMIHIHKPFPEAIGSIIAGCILGSMALKSRSIWPGVLVHTGIAFSMDFFALINSGRLARLF